MGEWDGGMPKALSEVEGVEGWKGGRAEGRKGGRAEGWGAPAACGYENSSDPTDPTDSSDSPCSVDFAQDLYHRPHRSTFPLP
jgi:hypothetical protein